MTLPPLHAAAFASALLLSSPASACATALILAMDVSNSIDPGEFQIQTHGLADALEDAGIAEELLRGEVALSVIQWSGVGQQEVSIPWRRMTTPADIRAFSRAARGLPRAFVMSDTGVGSFIDFALGQFGPVADCKRRVIDISGDGPDNAGTDPTAARRAAERAGVQINALAIEGIGVAITNFYRTRVITSDGFVMTARGHSTYAETLRQKIRREISAALF
jgi:Ca-activated chloride channel family protein